MRVSALALALACSGTWAQLVTPDPDWREAEAPPPPALRTDGLVPLDLGRGTDLRWGIDPKSVTIGPDRVVRYVVVALGQDGTVNALYEGLRCSADEVRVYARHARDGGWVPAPAAWKPVTGNPAQRHTLVIARQGACIGDGVNASASQIVRDLANGSDTRFRNEYR